jgi:hypothetical protein
MRKVKRYEVTDTRVKAKKVKRKTYRMVETSNGELVPRDPSYPLDGPEKIEKGRFKEVMA